MAIYFDTVENIFKLETVNTSYQIKIDPYGILQHLYYGAKIDGSAEYLSLIHI